MQNTMSGSRFGQEHVTLRGGQSSTSRGTNEKGHRELGAQDRLRGISLLYRAQYPRPESNGLPTVAVPVEGVFIFGSGLKN